VRGWERERILVVFWYCDCGWGSPAATIFLVWLSKNHNFFSKNHHLLRLCRKFTRSCILLLLARGEITEQCSHAPLFTWIMATLFSEQWSMPPLFTCRLDRVQFKAKNALNRVRPSKIIKKNIFLFLIVFYSKN
jgi:hypothetical protein